jgi:mono/diheme cytochrome c family protein
MNGWGMLVGGAIVAGIVVVVWQGFSTEQSSQGHSMVPPDTSKIAEGDPIAVVRLPSKLSSDALIGKRGFDAKCAACHGENATGLNGVAPPLVHKIYEPSHHADEAFQRAAKIGVRAHHWRFGDMPPVDGLTRADVKYITRYVRELQRENGIN